MSEMSPLVTFESQDPAIQIMVDEAHVLAIEANKGFNERLDMASGLSDMIIGNEGPELVKDAEKDFTSTDRYFRLYKAAAETIMPPRSAFEAPKIEAEESLASPEVWGAISREQQAFTLEARAALAAGKLSEHGVTKESLRILMTEVDGKNKFTLVHTGAGVDIGNSKKDYDRARSYNGVMSGKNDKVFQVKVNGVTYDSRSGMKSDVYDARVQDARDRNVILPDSQQLAAETKDVWTWTMMTGDGLTPADGLVPLRDVHGGEVYRSVDVPVDGDRSLRVCPAVEIPDFSSEV